MYGALIECTLFAFICLFLLTHPFTCFYSRHHLSVNDMHGILLFVQYIYRS